MYQRERLPITSGWLSCGVENRYSLIISLALEQIIQRWRIDG